MDRGVRAFDYTPLSGEAAPRPLASQGERLALSRLPPDVWHSADNLVPAGPSINPP